MYAFKEKIALVTGGTSGIGLAAASLLASRGAKVVVAARNQDTGESAIDQIRTSGGTAIFMPCDVSDANQCESLVADIVEKYGRLDIAHNNAGVATSGKLLHEYSQELWDETIACNLTGTWLCMKYELEVMKDQGGGAIVNSASIAGVIGYAKSALYTAAKHGIVGLTRNAAIDYGPYGIRVNAVCPGPVQTPMLEKAFAARGPDAKDWFLSRIPLGRFATVDDVAHAIAWLASDESAFVTGHTLFVDGGWTAQ